MKCLLFVVAFLAGSFAAHSQLTPKKLSAKNADTVYIGVKNPFIIDKQTKVVSFDKEFGHVVKENDTLAILPYKPGTFQVQYTSADTQQIFSKTFYSMYLPANKSH